MLIAFEFSHWASKASADPRDSKGTDFWIGFPANYPRPGITTQSNNYQQLLITSSYNTSGQVEIPGIGFSVGFSVNANSSTVVQFPLLVEEYDSDMITEKGIHVTSLHDITVYGLNKSVKTSGGFLALPTDILGKEYQVVSYRNNGAIIGNEFLIVGTVDGTVVTITPTATVGPRIAGVPYNITINEGQTYLLVDPNGVPSDLTGTTITSTEPIGVFGAHKAANIPRGASEEDHIVEMLLPESAYGRSFLTAPLATRTAGDFFRVIASEDSTEVSIDGVAQSPMSANQFFEVNLLNASQITSNRPVMVMQYAASSSFDGALGDPLMMIVPPYEQYCSTYVTATPLIGFSVNYLNITAPNDAVGNITLDGNVIPAIDFTPIGSSGFSYARVPVSPGSYSLNSDYRFGCHVYGFNLFEGYGYPAGTSAWELAEIVEIISGPERSTGEVGTQHCVQTRAVDGNGGPLAGIRVDFEQRGSNPGGGFSYTNDSGYATHCYIGNNPGADTILCRYYEFVDTLFKIWDVPLPVELVSFSSAVTGRDVELSWSTSEELNNSGFDIEKSSVEGDWTKVGFVAGNGTTSEARNYKYTDKNLATGKYKYRLKQIDYNGNFEYFNLSAEAVIGVPVKFELEQNYPNPFNPSTKINFSLPVDGDASLRVYDNSGRLAAIIMSGSIKSGYYSTDFDASGLPSGVYYYRLDFSGSGMSFTKTMKMALLK